MKCPVCANQLTEVEERGIALDVCRGGCGGIWFDADELQKFDETHEEIPPHLLRVEKNKQVAVDQSAPRSCPRCPGETMHRYYYDSNFSLEVDQCLNCDGIWLDLGELEVVRADNAKEAQRNAAIEAFNKKVSDPNNKGKVKNLRAVMELLFK